MLDVDNATSGYSVEGPNTFCGYLPSGFIVVEISPRSCDGEQPDKLYCKDGKLSELKVGIRYVNKFYMNLIAVIRSENIRNMVHTKKVTG